MNGLKASMLKMLGHANTFGGMEEWEFDAEAAIYWFAHNYHDGQSSPLYSILSTSPYTPGRMMNSVHDESEIAVEMYGLLEAYFLKEGTEQEY